jgi:mRNA-degrading endonuclease toxin of MazEF toxin-antitoxin module
MSWSDKAPSTVAPPRSRGRRRTTKAPRAGFPLTVHLPAGTGGNEVESRAKVTQIRVVAETRVRRPVLGSLTEAELGPVKKALRLVLDL